MKRTATHLAALEGLRINVKTDVQLLPAGVFKARDGRPGEGKHWRLNDDQGLKLAQKLSDRAARTRFNFDYDHQTLTATKGGHLAPASGWATKFEWRPGQGLYATDVGWTAKAAALIDAEEYIYISPLIVYDDDGVITDIYNASLVNVPALLGMEPVLAALQASLSFTTPNESRKDSSMDLLQMLIAALGLQATATNQDALSAIEQLKAKVTTAEQAALTAVPGQLRTALSLAETADLTAALSAVEQLKATSGQATSSVALIAQLQSQVAELSAKTHQAELDAVVDKAMQDGKLLPAMRDWAVGLGKKDMAALTAYIASAPVLGLGGKQSGKDGGDGGDGGNKAALSAAEADVVARLGITPEQFKQAAEAA